MVPARQDLYPVVPARRDLTWQGLPCLSDAPAPVPKYQGHGGVVGRAHVTETYIAELPQLKSRLDISRRVSK